MELRVFLRPNMALSLRLIIIFGVYMFRTTTPQQEAAGIGRLTSTSITVFSFLGAVCFDMAGYVGMWVSVRANFRVSNSARRSAREALQIAVRAGDFSALVFVGMAVLGVAILYSTFYIWLGVDSPGSVKVTDCECCKQNQLKLKSICNL